MISSAEIDVGNAIHHYGMKNVLKALISHLGYETDYEIQLKVDLRTALENYEKRHEEANNGDDAELEKNETNY